MTFVVWVAIGFVLAALAVWASRAIGRDGTFFGVGLLLLAFWYVGFGIVGGRDLGVLAPQILGGFVFFGLGVIGLRGSLVAISAGWFLHLAWDVLSPVFWDVAYMPGWTIPACLGFDTLVGGYMALRARGAFPLAVEAPAV